MEEVWRKGSRSSVGLPYAVIRAAPLTRPESLATATSTETEDLDSLVTPRLSLASSYPAVLLIVLLFSTLPRMPAKGQCLWWRRGSGIRPGCP